RASSSRWPRNSSEAFTAFGETGGALGAPSTRSHGSQPSCFLAYLRRGFVRRTKRRLAPVHPGGILLDEFLQPLGLTRYRLAKGLSVPPRRINEIVHGTRAITADTALRLARFF